MVTRANAGIIKPNPRHALTAAVEDIQEPTSITEALQQSGKLQGMNEELLALKENNT